MYATMHLTDGVKLVERKAGGPRRFRKDDLGTWADDGIDARFLEDQGVAM